MESSSLLGSYIHVVYENKKKVSKNVFEKYFSSEQKFRIFSFFQNLNFSNQCFFKIEKIICCLWTLERVSTPVSLAISVNLVVDICFSSDRFINR